MGLVLHLVFLALSAQHCGDETHNTEPTCTAVGYEVCLWNPTDNVCVKMGCDDFQHSTEASCTDVWVNDDKCVWNPNGGGQCQKALCGDFQHDTEATCKDVWVGNYRCEWHVSYCSGYYGSPGACNGYDHRTEEMCTVEPEKCVWNPITNTCGQHSCGDYQHNTEASCMATLAQGKRCVWNPNSGGGECQWASCGDFQHDTEPTCTGAWVNTDACVWDSANSQCDSSERYPGDCDGLNHRTELTCTDDFIQRTCLWNPTTETCGYEGCYDYQHNSEAGCMGTLTNSQICVWKSNLCQNATCGDAEHNTEPTCTNAWLNKDNVCVWDFANSACSASKRTPGSCDGFNYRTELTCTTDVYSQTCIWNPTAKTCGFSGCGDFQHSTEPTCTADTYCVWNPNGGGRCEKADCGDFQHDTEPTCTGASVRDVNCSWDPNDGGRCGFAHCNDFQHNSEPTCTGTTANGDICVWNPDSGGRCGLASCNDFQHESELTCTNTWVGNYACVWDFVNSDCTDNYRMPGYCDGFSHRTELTCTTDDFEQICLWNPATKICGTAGCDDFQHDTEPTCTGVVNGKACAWDSTNSDCNGVYCSEGNCADAPDEQACKTHYKDCRCVWADGACTKNSSAHNVMVPALVIAVLLAFLLF